VEKLEWGNSTSGRHHFTPACYLTVTNVSVGTAHKSPIFL
jgi:hypothetical protein